MQKGFWKNFHFGKRRKSTPKVTLKSGKNSSLEPKEKVSIVLSYTSSTYIICRSNQDRKV